MALPPLADWSGEATLISDDFTLITSLLATVLS